MENIIGNKYKLLGKIGEGSFGEIYKGQNIRTGELVAIKMETIESNTKLLKNESIIYQFLNGIAGIPNVKWFGKDDNFYYMVINLLGNSLQTIKNQKMQFSLKLTLQIGIQTLVLLRSIHEKGLVHRDIKPDNFLIGLNDKVKTIYLIDFGLCKTFSLKASSGNSSGLIGSPMYASINAHKLVDLTRRDDLESLGYMLIYFYTGELPWNEKINEDEIITLKNEILNNTYPQVLLDFLKLIRSMDFEEKPNYYLIINNFKREIELMSKIS